MFSIRKLFTKAGAVLFLSFYVGLKNPRTDTVTLHLQQNANPDAMHFRLFCED